MRACTHHCAQSSAAFMAADGAGKKQTGHRAKKPPINREAVIRISCRRSASALRVASIPQREQFMLQRDGSRSLQNCTRHLVRGAQCRHHEPAIKLFIANANHAGVVGQVCVDLRVVVEKAQLAAYDIHFLGLPRQKCPAWLDAVAFHVVVQGFGRIELGL